ncbi:MAG: phosphate acyltransferase PlsX [Mycoplasmataceae bacterium]|jgi:glycerol-3-phosphate acyltransferase PlsX|nr:phosphate acyltransferase PlsX [Mycoplasmataceae bacterium]
MRLVIDVCGGEAVPSEPIAAARAFLKQHKDVVIVLVGDEKIIKSYLNSNDRFEIVHAKDVVHSNDSVFSFLRNHETSLYKSVELVATGKADGVLSNSTTAAFTVVATSLLKLIPGINKPAFMSYIPTTNLKGMLLLDEGANVECTADDLVQFAKMANIYAKVISKIPSPSIMIANIGSEDTKGLPYHIEANKILKADKSLNYTGFIEGNHIIRGDANIVVADGYTGNIILKTLEGTLMAMKDLLKVNFKKPINIPGYLLSKRVINTITTTFDYKNYAAAFVLGLSKVACKTHGNAKEKEFSSSLRMLREAVINDLPSLIKNNIK